MKNCPRVILGALVLLLGGAVVGVPAQQPQARPAAWTQKDVEDALKDLNMTATETEAEREKRFNDVLERLRQDKRVMDSPKRKIVKNEKNKSVWSNAHYDTVPDEGSTSEKNGGKYTKGMAILQWINCYKTGKGWGDSAVGNGVESAGGGFWDYISKVLQVAASTKEQAVVSGPINPKKVNKSVRLVLCISDMIHELTHASDEADLTSPDDNTRNKARAAMEVKAYCAQLEYLCAVLDNYSGTASDKADIEAYKCEIKRRKAEEKKKAGQSQ